MRDGANCVNNLNICKNSIYCPNTMRLVLKYAPPSSHALYIPHGIPPRGVGGHPYWRPIVLLTLLVTAAASPQVKKFPLSGCFISAICFYRHYKHCQLTLRWIGRGKKEKERGKKSNRKAVKEICRREKLSSVRQKYRKVILTPTNFQAVILTVQKVIVM